jgi:hypothetical protein
MQLKNGKMIRATWIIFLVDGVKGRILAVITEYFLYMGFLLNVQ